MNGSLAAAMFTIGFLAWPGTVVAVRLIRSRQDPNTLLENLQATPDASPEILVPPPTATLVEASIGESSSSMPSTGNEPPAHELPLSASNDMSAPPTVSDEAPGLATTPPAPEPRRRAKRKIKKVAAATTVSDESKDDGPRPAALLQAATVSESMDSFNPTV